MPKVFFAWLLAFKRVHDTVLKSRLPACFFLLISLSRLFVRPNPDPALLFLQVSCFHLIQCLRLTFLQQGALMFKVLDFVISDRNFFFLFCLFIYVFFFWVHQYKKEGFLRSEFWPFGNSQLSWVDGCFDFFTAKFHQAMKTIVYADYGSWKMCMNTMVAQIDIMFSFIWKHKPGMKSNSTAKCKKPPCRKFTVPPFSNLVLDSCLEFLFFLPFLNLHKNRCVWPATVCKTVLFSHGRF